MRRGGCVLIPIALIVAAFLVLKWVHAPVRYNYRMTVEISTPEGLKSGSGVQQLEVIPTLPLLTATEYTTMQHGDAVAVDLPDGSTLFVLLNQTIPYRAFSQGGNKDLRATLSAAESGREYTYSPVNSANEERLKVGGGTAVYRPNYVKFRDVSDPSSIYAIDPRNVGDGAAIRRITVELTHDRLTRSIDRRLPWLASYEGKYLNGQRPTILAPSTDGPLAAWIRTGAFRLP